jgi:hypothetical protein
MKVRAVGFYDIAPEIFNMGFELLIFRLQYSGM